MKITALTSCCVDVFPEQNKMYVGGNSLNFATQCKISQIDEVALIGGIGKDEYGNQIINHLKKMQLDHSRIYRIDAPTASNKIFIDDQGDRYFKADSWNGGAFDAFRLSESDWSALQDSSIVAMPAGDPNLAELLKRKNPSQLVVIDFLDYFGLEDITHHIKNIDIVFLSGKETMLNDLNVLSQKSGKMIVATLGAKGSIAYFNNNTYIQKAIAVDQIIDTTGCGDAFQAAFSIAWVRTNSIHRALEAGALAASKVLGFVGAVQ
ncbi:MAG: PfkB family carbohydrate kinase [Saprospiraceae bacterium]|nr:PfkB family carbohydrate kinase [Saprospiraceae bacterium]